MPSTAWHRERQSRRFGSILFYAAKAINAHIRPRSREVDFRFVRIPAGKPICKPNLLKLRTCPVRRSDVMLVHTNILEMLQNGSNAGRGSTPPCGRGKGLSYTISRHARLGQAGVQARRLRSSCRAPVRAAWRLSGKGRSVPAVEPAACTLQMDADVSFSLDQDVRIDDFLSNQTASCLLLSDFQKLLILTNRRATARSPASYPGPAFFVVRQTPNVVPSRADRILANPNLDDATWANVANPG